MGAPASRWLLAGAALLLAGLARPAAAQTTSLAIPLDTSCSALKFFDISHLTCEFCPTGSFPDTNQMNCVACDTSTGSFFNSEAGLSISQTWSAALLQSSTSCACVTPVSNRTFIATAESNGVTYQRCVVCPSGTVANAQGRCAPGGNSSTLTPGPLVQLSQAISLLGVTGLTVTQAVQAFITIPSSSGGSDLQLTIQQSAPLAELLGPAALACAKGAGADREACGAVANLCALTLYDSESGPCRLYEALVTRLTATSETASPPPPPSSSRTAAARRGSSFRPDTAAMPWLFYDLPGYTDDANFNLSVAFSGGSLSSGKVSVLTFVISAYALNGTWLGYTTWQTQWQLCGAPADGGERWTRVGWNYNNVCQLGLETLQAALAPAFTGGTGETVMYELFIQTGVETLYPIPIQITNKDELDGQGPNGGAVRRFFFVDSRLGYSAQSGRLQALQYPKSMSLSIVLRQEPRDAIFVPLLTISYGGWQTDTLSSLNLDSAAANEQRSVSFSVWYNNEDSLNSRFWYAWQTVMIVFQVVLGFPVMMLLLFRYLRKKRGGEQADVDLIVYAIVCIADVGSFMLAMVLLVVGLYYLIIYKLQEEIYFLMLPDSELYNWKITVILAIVGQSLGLAYAMWKQVRTDVFFIDWEKSRKVLSKEGSREEPAPVSCWRTLLVANEWNELQTTRVTYPPFTLLMLVMILEGANVIAAGYVTPDANDFHSYFATTTSIILRFGVEAAFLLVLFVGQYLLKRLIYYPYIADPVTQFVDLAFLANISVLIFDDTHSGYYIHGRNQAQHSDATLRDLNQELLKEEEGLTAQRGLAATSSNPKLADNQTFLMYVTDSIRKTYDAKMLQLVAQATMDARGRKGAVSTFLRGSGRQAEKVLTAQEEIATLFKHMVDDVERNQAQQLVDPTYMQRVLQLPPDNALNAPAFVHDYFNSFTRTIFIGTEVRLYVFEALFFCAIDMSLRNVPLSALITFLVIRAVSYVRAQWGEDNLSQKTLVDRHFLI